ncbi:3575_t:CDS:1, partial [Gigaspora rosea]
IWNYFTKIRPFADNKQPRAKCDYVKDYLMKLIARCEKYLKACEEIGSELSKILVPVPLVFLQVVLNK